MEILQMLLVIAKVVEISVIVILVLISATIIWDLTEERRVARRRLRVLKQREIRRGVRTEEVKKRAQEQLRLWKEADARRRFFDDAGFEDEFTSNFDSQGNLVNDEWLVPTDESRAYLDEMKKLDDDITINTFIEGAV